MPVKPESRPSFCLDHACVRAWLTEPNPAVLEDLWAEADRVRQAHVGDAVHLRGLIEVSSHCVRHCLYCGLRAPSEGLERYRMTAGEILACAQEAVALGTGSWADVEATPVESGGLSSVPLAPAARAAFFRLVRR